MKIPIKVLIADNHSIVRNGVKSLIEKQNNIEVVAEAANGLEVLRLLQSGIAPNIVLTDIAMPEMDGIELTKLIRLNYPEIKVLILTSADQEGLVISCFEAGAHGYLLKDVSITEVVFAIEKLFAGFKHLSTAIGLKLLDQVQGKYELKTNDVKTNIQLSKRELEILRMIAEGSTNGEIAEKLFTSKRTIEGNRQNLLNKTGQKNTAALINFVVRNGIID
ncbi:response regulator transcription factor [Pedobacter sp. Leaf250]|uniref:response regulator transcription factor n=1 Tax=Pedobacter sp. Leaf250 TaxID=2876559 RepID=UPI001E428E79|nr:response regulator transcription factor [Pedobacter sp. Leaf250]